MVTIHYSHGLKHVHHIDIIPIFCAIHVYMVITVLHGYIPGQQMLATLCGNKIILIVQ